MTFGESINRCLKEKYFNFNGRASRSEYWWFTLFQFIIYLVIIFATGLISYVADEVGVMIGAEIIATLVFLVPNIAVGVRRLHDINMSGWWYLINFIPFGGIIFFVFLVLPGTDGSNRFGDVSD